MSKEKQIEEMADVYDAARLKARETLGSMNEGEAMWYSKAFYNAGYHKSEWISVEERLPSEDEQRDEYEELVPFLVVERDTKYPYRAFYDGNEWGDGLMKIRGITHWMPLPEPPKMKGGAE